MPLRLLRKVYSLSNTNKRKRDIMRIRKYYLGLTIMIGILCVPAHGEVERPSMENMPLLVGQPEPALRGIRQLYIVILPPDAEPNKDGLVWNDLEKAVEGQISQAGIKIAEAIRREHTLRSLAIPELRININMLKIEEPNQYIFHTETSLAKKVYLTGNFSQHLKVDVWKAEPAMQAVSAQGMPAAVTSAVLEQVEAFTHAHHAANPQHKRPSDVNDVNEESKEKAEPP